MTRCGFAVDRATLAAGSYDQTPPLICDEPGQLPNVIFHTQDIVDAVGRPLQPHEEDWLDFLRAIHVADILCLRGRNEGWNREIELAVPLRDIERVARWLPLARQLFGQMTHDALRIRLEPMSQPPAQRFPRVRARRSFDAVALLSGGLDSAAGAARLMSSGARPCLVSCNSSPHVSAAQDAVVAQLAAKFGEPGHRVKFKVDTLHSHDVAPLPKQDLTQRSRTLLYAGVAALIASAHGVDTVTLAENGIMAINAPLTPGRIGGFSTHTAHPDVLAMMGRLFTAALYSSITVHNPLIERTKTEVVKELVPNKLEAMIPLTHSCWIARQKVHCGTCVPCVVRRLATLAANVPDAKYQTDPFASPPDPGDDKFANLGDYIWFAKTVANSTPAELELQFSELNIEGGPEARAPVLAAHFRWAGDVQKVLSRFPVLAALM
jgi:7-cyano-7-deazaguanine synthase in queuosine biosynthesis